MCRILHDGESLIGEIKEIDGCPQHATTTQQMQIQQMPHTNHGKDQYLPANFFESDLAGKLSVCKCAHEASEIIQHCKNNQRVEHPIISAQEVSQPSTDYCEYCLDHIPEFLHHHILLH